jgi:hypothetical protein
MPKQVFIPFKKDFKELMLSGRKTTTTRPRRYGRPGDLFPAFGETFVLTEIHEVHLNFVAVSCYMEEGFNSPTEFSEYWNKLHYRVSFEENPERMVYLHRFSFAILEI